MAGNRQVFEQAMSRGTNYAWDKQWNRAIAEYQRAVAEFPGEAPAYTALGQALVYAGRTQEALRVYQRAARLTPDDPSAFERVAELQEKSGNMAGCIQTWLHTADVHLRHRDVDAAVKIWNHLVDIAPDTVAAHERLAKAYAGMDQTRKAVRQYLSMAAIYQQSGDDERAAAACQRALALDPRDPDVLSALESLQHGRSIADLVQGWTDRISYTAFGTETEVLVGAGNLVEMTRQKALTTLAGALLEDSSIGGMDVTAALLQAVDFQARGEIDAAIESYEQAIRAGSQHAAAHFNLGLLYQEKLQFEDAVEQFERAAVDSDYALGAHFALGECWRALRRLDEAVVHFVKVLELLDLSTVGPENATLVQQTYDALARRYVSGEKRGSVAVFVNALVEFLSHEQWEDRLFEIRQRLNRLGDDRVICLAEVVPLPNFERVLHSMIKSKEYLDQGRLHSASEECLWAIEQVPDYLPLHLHLASLFRQGNQIGVAIKKYAFVADTYAVRGEMEQAKALYDQVLRFAPMDLKVRHKLIALLEQHHLMDAALEHHLALADAYYELAQIEASRERYHKALHLAAKLPNSKVWSARILHRLGDVDLQRLDWRSAIKVYQQLKAAVPEDIRARQRLVTLYLNLERRSQGVAELDELIALYRRQGELQAALEALEEMVAAQPQELELHKRAAQLGVETGSKEVAISHLDTMGELQLQAGDVQEAAATIKAIIALGPENVEAYRQLLEQIS